MALADLARQTHQRPARKCGTCWLLETLPPDGDNGSNALRHVLQLPGVTSQAIAAELANAGHPITAQSIGRHRRGLCSSEETA